MLFSSQALFMLHHKICSSQIRTTPCEEHSESPIRHRLKIPKLLCDSRSDRYLPFGPTEIIKLIYVFDLGATDLNHSVTPSCNNCIQFCISVPPSCSTRSHRQGRAIYRHGQKFGNFSEPLRPRDSSLCQRGLRIVFSPQAASSHWSPSPSTGINPAVAAIVSLRRTRVWTRSLCYSPIRFLAHCDHIDSCHV